MIDGKEEQFELKLGGLFSNGISIMCFWFNNSRSRDRFVESSQQIEALVQRFARETPLPDVPINPMGSGKVPLSYGKPGEIKVWGMLYL